MHALVHRDAGPHAIIFCREDSVPVTPQDVELYNDVVSGAVMYPQGLTLIYLGVEALSPHPLNANSTDIDPIVESIEVNGFIQPVLVQQSTGYIIDGWHRYTAARSLGATQIPAIVIDVDDSTARRLLVAINRTARLGRDDPGLLRDLMDLIRADDERLLGTGWHPLQYDAFLEAIDAPYTPELDDIEPEPIGGARQRGQVIHCPACGHEFGGGR